MRGSPVHQPPQGGDKWGLNPEVLPLTLTLVGPESCVIAMRMLCTAMPSAAVQGSAEWQLFEMMQGLTDAN